MKKILIVEDEPEIAEMLADAVKCAGGTPIIAFNALEAKYKAMENVPNGAILDLVVPGESPVGLLKTMKVPYVLYTGAFFVEENPGEIVFYKPSPLDDVVSAILKIA